MKKTIIENIPSKTILKTKHTDSYDWVTTIVKGMFNDYIEIEQVEEYLGKVLMIGDKIICKYENDNFIYNLETTVYNIKIASRSVVLLIHFSNKVKSTRKDSRLDVYLSAGYTIAGSHGETYSIITNISKSGIGFISKGKLELNEIVELVIYVSFSKIITSLCEIKWVKTEENKFIYGTKLLEMDNISKKLFKNLISHIVRHEKHILTKFNKMMESNRLI